MKTLKHAVLAFLAMALLGAGGLALADSSAYSTILAQYNYTDPDNENNVTNDDNNLTITFGTPFDQNGEFTPIHTQSGQHPYTV